MFGIGLPTEGAKLTNYASEGHVDVPSHYYASCNNSNKSNFSIFWWGVVAMCAFKLLQFLFTILLLLSTLRISAQRSHPIIYSMIYLLISKIWKYFRVFPIFSTNYDLFKRHCPFSVHNSLDCLMFPYFKIAFNYVPFIYQWLCTIYMPVHINKMVYTSTIFFTNTATVLIYFIAEIEKCNAISLLIYLVGDTRQ